MKVGIFFGINSFVLSSLLIIFIVSFSELAFLRAPLVTLHILFFSLSNILFKTKLYSNFGIITLILLFVYVNIQNLVLQTELLFTIQSFLMVVMIFLSSQIAALCEKDFIRSNGYTSLSKYLLFFYPLLAVSFTSWSQTSSPGLFMNPNITGHISIMLIPFILIGFMDKRKIITLLWMMALFVVVITESRSTLMAWMLSLFSYLIVSRFPQIKFLGVTILIFLTTLFSSYAMVVAKWLLFNSLNLSGKYNTRFLYLEYNGRDTIWEYAINKFYEQPFFGLGFGGAKFEIEGHVLDTHNGFLEILIRLGLIGTLIFLIYILNLCYMISKSHPSFKPALTVSVVAIMSLATNSSTFFVFNYLFLYVNIIVYASYVGNKKLKASQYRGSIVV